MKTSELQRILDISIALSREQDRARLLELILRSAMDLTDCDAGTLYVYEGGKLEFRVMITLSMNYYKGVDGETIHLPPVPLRRENVCACSAIERRLINIEDVYVAEGYDFRGPREYDAMTGYRTQSMLVVPMENHYGELIGVVQLINALDDAGTVIPFGESRQTLVTAMASQAATCLTNMRHTAEISGMLDSFVQVMAAAIDERSPYNANHTRNMVRYAERFLSWLDVQNDAGRGLWAPEADDRRQLILSLWLHDVGKLVIPLEIMDKPDRLGAQKEAVFHRLETLALCARIERLEDRLGKEEYSALAQELSDAIAFIRKSDAAPFMDDAALAEVRRLAARSSPGPGGEAVPWLTEAETHSLSIRKGTLTDEERELMQSHVSITARLLGEMSFPRRHQQVARWASEHHEFLDGSGYPEHLADGAIPNEVRLITLLDIFESLTACDRPYKRAMPPQRALSILGEMAGEGKIDPTLLALFTESRAWEEPTTAKEENDHA